MINNKKKYKTKKLKDIPLVIILIMGLSILLSGIISYVSVFSDGFSNNIDSWKSFGTFISGISNVSNIFIFIYISLLIRRIDSNHKNKELTFKKNMEIFNRLIEDYFRLNSSIIKIKRNIKISYLSNNKLLKRLLIFQEDLLTFYEIIQLYNIKINSTFHNQFTVTNDSIIKLSGALIQDKKENIIKSNQTDLLNHIDKFQKHIREKIITQIEGDLYES